ncbi:MAG: 1-deoxy-D-xylulose-5-phosphate reductoisomerase [bacterium]|nr:1-deoxy-D-xylulose-5-phosphate reductoisomerase [bacterium]
MKKGVVILGSTGSIGRNALHILRHFPAQFRIIGLSAGRNIRLLKQQIKEYNPELVAVHDPHSCRALRKEKLSCEIREGENGIKELCSLKNAPLLLNAIIGSSGLKYTVEAILHKKTIALANKESYVMAGLLLDRLLKKYNARIIPVDSEHSALFHLLQNLKKEDVESLILTASGGPFLHKPREYFQRISLRETLKHPVWSMGSKITVDSATMMNKGFEVIEAHHLFHISYDRIKVVIHPQSLIHSMVQTIDGEIYSQMSPPDMRYAILNALTFPEKFRNPLIKFNFRKDHTLSFQEPDYRKFPLLRYAYTIGRKGGNAPASLCVADDIVVRGFLNKKIKFSRIYPAIRYIVSRIKYVENPDLNNIFWLERHINEKYSPLLLASV